MNPRVLVIDDDEGCRQLVRAIFRGKNIEIEMAHDGLTGLECINRLPPDVVLLDVQLPDCDGLDVLKQIKDTRPALPVLMLTGSTSVKHAVRATQLGAFDYITKPIDRDELLVSVQRARETLALRREVESLRRRIGQDPAEALVAQMGASAHVERVIEQVRTVAASNFTVLILGETGTGKELVSRAIHDQSARRSRPFTAVDCGAIPDTLLESELFGHERGAFTGAERKHEGRLRLAQGGTCFLDEVGNMPVGVQAKLLRVLESGEVQAVGAERSTPMDVRFLAATNRDLQAESARGEFRSDLYYRLAQYTLTLPALRERPDDIPYLATRFMQEAANELRRPVEAITPEAIALLQAQPWTGNVRELRNVVRQTTLYARDRTIREDDVRRTLGASAAAPATAPTDTPMLSLRSRAELAARAAEREAIITALKMTNGNKSQASKMLQTDYKTLHSKMKQLGIRAGDFSK